MNECKKEKKGRKIILHLCADLGSDSRFYQLDDNYEVIMIGKEIGVENYEPPENVHGIIANPVCTEFSNAKNADIPRDYEKGMFLVKHCQRIIEKAKPKWWVMENPSTGALRNLIGKPTHTILGTLEALGLKVRVCGVILQCLSDWLKTGVR